MEDGKKPLRSPKKWTVEDALLIKKLKEEDGLSWAFFPPHEFQLITRAVATYFPGQTTESVKSRYSQHLKALCETFTEEEVLLRRLKLTPEREIEGAD